jgi:CPA2 family monovalent cation:H+ antiporter-2
VQTLSELGVILLMFALGLEFRFRKLAEVAPIAGLTALVECSLMGWLGFAVARLLGWSLMTSMFTAGVVAISSTTVIARTFDERGVKGPLRELVVGILIVEDLIAVLLLATFTTVASSREIHAGDIAMTTGRLAAFLVALLVIGMLVVPRAIRAIHKIGRPETLLIASMGICFACALLAHHFGYSVALGAFIAGALVAESDHGVDVEHLIHPVRDIFAAVFFVSVGMSLDPLLVAKHWLAIAVLTVVVIGGKTVGVTLGAFFTGNGTRRSIEAGMSLAQIGEFSFIIAGLGAALGASSSFLYAVAVAVSAITTLTTPWLIRISPVLAKRADNALPNRLQTFAALYGTWIEQARSRTSTTRASRYIGLLLVDFAALVGIVIGASLNMQRGTSILVSKFAVDTSLAHVIVVLAAGLVAAPFVYGIVHVARSFADAITERAFNKDTGDAARNALRLALQLGIITLVGAPLVALTQPFLPGGSGAASLAAILLVLTVLFWRSATNLRGHVRAGATIVVDALTPQAVVPQEKQLHALVPGLGTFVAITLDATSFAVGWTLAQLDLRGSTGATVLAITRLSGEVITPTATDTLREGDTLALIGPPDAIASARRILGKSSETELAAL